MSLGSATLALDSAPGSRLATLPDWPWGPYDKEAPRTLGWEAARWCESGLLLQPNGPRAGLPFRLTAGQFKWLLWWYALDGDAQFLYGHGCRRLAKGSGKSPFAGVQCLLEFVGPCRLQRFDDRAMGGCRVKPAEMPLVQIAATAESQTANTMRMVRAFAPKRSPLVEHYNLDVGKTQYYKVPEGTLEIITSSASAAEGAESTFVIGDQTERWVPSNGGPDLFATLADNLAKSGARMVETPNAWTPGSDSVAELTWDAWVAQEEGRTVDERAVLYDAKIAPPDASLDDPVSCQAALEWVYGDCDWKKPAEGAPPDVRPILKRIYTLTAQPDDSLRKYFNWPTAAEDAWVTSEEWAVLADPSRVVAAHEQVALFFDGSKSQDATALIGCCLSDGHVFTVGVWEPKPDRVVPVADVELAVATAFDMWDVVGFFADVREWESQTKTTWPELYGDKLQIMAVPAGKEEGPIAWDMRSRTLDFTKACELTLAEIVDRKFTHDGDSRVARHVANARRKPNRFGVSIGKESRASSRKIDAAVCVVGARMVRRLAITAGAGKKKRVGTVY